MPATSTTRFSIGTQNGILVKITEYREHSNGTVSGSKAPAVKCWPQNRTEKQVVLASEAYVNYKVPVQPKISRHLFLWLYQELTRTQTLYAPFYCGTSTITYYEMWPVPHNGVVAPDPRIPTWPFGFDCKDKGGQFPEVCAMDVVDESVATLKAISLDPSTVTNTNPYWFGSNENFRHRAGHTGNRDTRNQSEISAMRLGRTPSNSNGAYQVRHTLRWFPVDCFPSLWQMIVPEKPQEFGDPLAVLSGPGGAGSRYGEVAGRAVLEVAFASPSGSLDVGVARPLLPVNAFQGMPSALEFAAERPRGSTSQLGAAPSLPATPRITAASAEDHSFRRVQE